ncbi:uncharacterized protein LOC111864096 isoform X3 [Cryptotermes secundus]|uniref:uncharacterized protein LOC111864096 isoform X3 n=1 Tax=Cryptotermes secundus TaxID=105785 RepID=UPI000CD7CC69|nr:uncharacterized protein LOC111864096 isoform X3 [Cryptotermes secundus]
MHNPQTIMCDEQFLNPHKFPHSATRVPKMIVQRVEEIFPALKESLEKTTVKVEDDVDVQSEEDSIDMKSHKDYVPAVLSEEKTDPENCRDLVEVVPGSCSEICVMTQDIKVEELSDIQEEEDPLLLPVPIIKAEHEG